MKRLIFILMLWCGLARGATVTFQLTNGMILQPTNFFLLHIKAGTNIAVIDNGDKTVTIGVTNLSGGGGTTFVNGSAVTNVNLSNDAYVKWAVVGTNAYAYITNWFSWESIPIPGRPNLRDDTYIAFVPSGSNIVAVIRENSINNDRLEQMQTGYILGRAAGTFGDVEYIEIGANLNLATNGVLSAIVSGSSNGTPISVNAGGVLIEGNFADNSEIDFANSGSNITATLVANSITTNKIDSGFRLLLLDQYRINNLTNWFLSLTNNATDTGRVVWYTNANGDWVAYATNLPAGGGSGNGTNAFVNGVLLQPFRLTNNATDTGRVIWYTNASGDVLAYATNLPAGGGGGAGTNAFVNGVLVQPLYLTNSTEVFWSTNGNGHVVLDVNDWDGFWSDLTNSLVASNNVSFAYDTSNNKLLISAIVSTNSGTSVSVDGGAALSVANFTDSTGIEFVQGFPSTTNILARLVDRDFGDITTSSSGTVMTIDADSVALGTDTTGNFIATISGTGNEVDVSGSGSENAAVTLSLSSTVDLGGKTSFEIPNGASPTTDAFGEIAGDNNAWASGRGAVQFFDGTANTLLIGALASDTPSNGQVPKWNTGGTITWEDDNNSGGGGGAGTNFFLNGTLIQPAYITNSSTLVWSTNSNGHVLATVTNVAGTTTDNMVQLVGSAYFTITNNSTIGDFSYESLSGIISDINCTQCDNDRVGKIDFTFSTLATNYFWTLTREGDSSVPFPIGSHVWEDTGNRTSTSLRLFMMDDGGSVTFSDVTGYMFRFNLYATATVGGNGSGSLSVNGSSVSTPNLTNSTTVTWSASGSNITATAKRTGVVREIWVPANAMNPGSDTPTASTNIWATTTDGQYIETWDFSATSTNSLYFTLTLPQAWDASTVKMKLHWKQVAAEANTTNVWAVGGGSLNDDETGGNTLGTLVTVLDQGLNDTNKVAITAASSAITIGGSPSAGHMTWFTIKRHPGNSSDNMTVSTRLFGAHLQFTETSTEPSAW